MAVVVAVILMLGVLSLDARAPEQRTIHTARDPSSATTRVDGVGTPRLTCTDQIYPYRDLTLPYASQGRDAGTAPGNVSMIESLRHAAVIVLIAFGPMSATAADAAGSASAEATIDRTELAWSDGVPNERARAELWDVSVTEWRRYRQLMAGIRGSISPANLSPIEVLGIHARDAAERRRYAEQWAVMMREDAERILAFQHAYDQANHRLYPDEPLIDRTRLPERVEDEEALRATDRVLLFARPTAHAVTPSSSGSWHELIRSPASTSISQAWPPVTSRPFGTGRQRGAFSRRGSGRAG